MTDGLTIKTERRGPGRWYWRFGGDEAWKGPFATEAQAVANADRQALDYLRCGDQHRWRSEMAVAGAGDKRKWAEMIERDRQLRELRRRAAAKRV